MENEKKEYTVSALITISVRTVVLASSEEEALEEASSREVMSLCNTCASSRYEDCEWVTSGELDGSPLDLRVESHD